MPKLVIIGGKLQGTEVCYLGAEAGFEVILIDKNPNTPARDLSSFFICADVMNEDKNVEDALKSADLVIPTMENNEVLYFLVNYCNKLGIGDRLAFDWNAYKISCSKIKSDNIFHTHGLPAPRYYPEGNFPYIAKPSNDSGSHGVKIIKSQKELNDFSSNRENDNYIIQEYVEGPSYSVEIIGVPGNYRAYELTEIFVDDEYDCYSVSTLYDVDKSTDTEIKKIAVEIAELIELKGIMDLEVIVAEGQVKILEIDARFPSQTPIVVYHASGVNYVKEIYDLFTEGDFQDELTSAGKYASLIHYMIGDGSFKTLGEHIMVEGEPLSFTDGITGDATVISDYASEREVWRSVFIFSADTIDELKDKAENIEEDLRSFLNKREPE